MEEENELFEKDVAQAISDLREALVNMGWIPCIDEKGQADTTKVRQYRLTDLVGKTVIVFKGNLGNIHRYVYSLVAVTISYVELTDHAQDDGKLVHAQFPHFCYRGEDHTAYPLLDMYDKDFLDEWHLIAVEQTESK